MKPAPVKKNGYKKKVIPFVAGAIVCGGIMFGIQRMATEKLTVEKQLLVLSNEINKGCPVMIDQGTRFDNVIALPGNIFQYRYTLVNADRMNVDTTGLKNFVLPNAIKSIKASPQLKYQRENKISFSYYYRDGRGEYVLDFIVTPEQYGKDLSKK